MGGHTIKNVQKKSFTEVVHFILSQSIKYFDISLLNDSRSFKFGERSHTPVQICELYSEDVLIIYCAASGIVGSLIGPFYSPNEGKPLVYDYSLMLLSSEVKMLADIAVSIVTVPPFSVLIDG